MIASPAIAVVCNSKHVLTDQLSTLVAACEIQLTEFCSAWGRYPTRVRYYAMPSSIPAGMPTIVITDDAHEPGALAWHTEDTDGRVSGVVDAAACIGAGGGVLTGEPSIASALSHELLEAEVDPQVNLWVERPDGELVAREVCDPVQDQTYTITMDEVAVSVSSYVLPAWFDDSPPAHVLFDRGGVLTAPFTRTPGGYMVLRRGGVTIQDGKRAPHKSHHASSRGMMRARRQLCASPAASSDAPEPDSDDAAPAELLVQLALACVGAAARPGKYGLDGPYEHLIAPGETEAATRDMALMSGCGLVVRGLWRRWLDELALPVPAGLCPPYHPGSILGLLLGLATRAGALAPPSATLEPGDVIWLDAPEHVEIYVGDGYRVAGGQRTADGRETILLVARDLDVRQPTPARLEVHHLNPRRVIRVVRWSKVADYLAGGGS